MEQKKKVWVFGDSTTQEYTEKSYPVQGWAYYLREMLNDEITYINVGHAGYTLKTFLYSEAYREGKTDVNEPEKSLWNQILSQIRPGDLFVFYWAGVNDMGSIGKNSYREKAGGEYVRDFYFTDRDVYLNVGEGFGTHTFFTLRSSVSQYTELLVEMLKQLRQQGAEVLLVRGTGKYYKRNGAEKDVFAASHEYMRVMKQAAEQAGVPYLNVGEIFEQEFAEIGFYQMMVKYFLYAESRKYYAALKGMEYDGSKADDNVHYNPLGARRICEIFREEVRKIPCSLNEYWKED